ncbi:MAG: hypothetical protein A2Z99_01325 [Treponema sp. GWB1_62_6]|nr:MAG: hypothetical protein A2Z99_01325 [Treponema sp. GWB1_62_6]OHE66887.1 MAG: hypothetical protein A2001_04790 [Treponema sp. GWC1_61_84]HCM26174.1 hypothetical protein [Treponema sp.]
MPNEAEDPGSSEYQGYRTLAAYRMAFKIDEVFSSLEVLPFLRPRDRKEFRYFRRLFRTACAEIDARVDTGAIKPWSKRSVETLLSAASVEFPRARRSDGPEAQRHKAGKTESGKDGATRCLAVPPGTIRAGIFIGSFDPFQMTHLETALRFLSRGDRPADLVIVVPEGAYSNLKPGRSEYDYRFDILRRQAAEAFCPFVVPLDIGENQDTIGIVKRIISLFSGRRLELTHVLGSDVFPMASRWYPEDLAAWRPFADRMDTDLDFASFVVKRAKGDQIADAIRAARMTGVQVQVDPRPIGTPSSTELREQGVFTIVFPTEEVLEKLEVVFRYGMHRNWLTDRGSAEYEI